MSRKAKVYLFDQLAGLLEETVEGYIFQYDKAYLKLPEAKAISLTMPLAEEPYLEKVLHPFFDGLIPEGWMLNIVEQTWKLDAKDRMGLLLACCKDCIGAVSVVPEQEVDHE